MKLWEHYHILANIMLIYNKPKTEKILKDEINSIVRGYDIEKAKVFVDKHRFNNPYYDLKDFLTKKNFFAYRGKKANTKYNGYIISSEIDIVIDNMEDNDVIFIDDIKIFCFLTNLLVSKDYYYTIDENIYTRDGVIKEVVDNLKKAYLERF